MIRRLSQSSLQCTMNAGGDGVMSLSLDGRRMKLEDQMVMMALFQGELWRKSAGN